MCTVSSDMSLLSRAGHQGYPLRPGRRGDRRPLRRSGRTTWDEQQVRRIALVGVLALALILLVIFIVQNSDSVSVSFVFFSGGSR